MTAPGAEGGVTAPRAAADVSNVVLITVDSLRADAVSGPGDRLTPEIGSLAGSGTVFENAFTHGNWTPFAFPSMLASRPVFAESGDIGLPSSPALAEVLRDAGIRTAGFNAANGFLTAHWGYDRGFDEFEAFIGSGDNRYGRYLAAHPTIQAWLQLATSPFRRLASRIRGGAEEQPFTDTSRLLDIERRGTEFVADDGPFFLWLHYMDTHTPYVPAPRYLREVSGGRLETHRIVRAHARTGLGLGVSDRTLDDLRTLYDATVRQVDASVGRVVSALKDAGVADETAVIVAGDHGEEFMEHGHLAHYPKLYRELIHVPLVVSVPGRDPGGMTEAVGLEGIPPTVCDLLNVDPPATWDGRRLPRAGDGDRTGTDRNGVGGGDGAAGAAGGGGAGSDRAPIVSVAVRGESVTQQPIPRRRADGRLLASARTTRWTYVEDTVTGRRELYDRRRDPGERTNRLAADDDPPPAVDDLEAAVAAHVEALGSDAGDRDRDEEPLDDGIADRLDALGYR